MTSIFVVRCEIAWRLLFEFDDDTGDNSFDSVAVDKRVCERRVRYSWPVVVDSTHDVEILPLECSNPFNVWSPFFNGI
jgi:hypothetical protein